MVQLQRAPANALGEAEVAELSTLIDSLAKNEACRAIIFFSSDRFFSAGADIKFMADQADNPDAPERLGALAKNLQDVYQKLEALPVPSLAALSGIATGGGFELALACDLRIADRSARVGLPEARIGLLPGAGGIHRVTKISGPAIAKRVIMTGEIFAASEAAALGLINEVVDDGQCRSRAIELAKTMAQSPKETLAAIKRCIALAPSDAGLKAEINETIALQKQPATKSLIKAFIGRSKGK